MTIARLVRSLHHLKLNSEGYKHLILLTVDNFLFLLLHGEKRPWRLFEYTFRQNYKLWTARTLIDFQFELYIVGVLYCVTRSLYEKFAL